MTTTPPPPPLRVPISPDALNGITQRARRRIESLTRAGMITASEQPGRILANNIRGVAGEQAVLRWLRTRCPTTWVISDVADNPGTPVDIEVTTPAGTFGIEVKSTNYDDWCNYGRTIDADQLWTTTANLYCWCAAPSTPSPTEVHILGWSTTADVRSDHTPQRYGGITTTSAQHAPTTFNPHADSSPPGPDYDLDDPGFDTHEWAQHLSHHRPESEPSTGTKHAIDDAPSQAPNAARQGLLVEGDLPRPGFGHRGTEMVHITATIRPLADLIQWLQQQKPLSE